MKIEYSCIMCRNRDPINKLKLYYYYDLDNENAKAILRIKFKMEPLNSFLLCPECAKKYVRKDRIT